MKRSGCVVEGVVNSRLCHFRLKVVIFKDYNFGAGNIDDKAIEKSQYTRATVEYTGILDWFN